MTTTTEQFTGEMMQLDASGDVRTIWDSRNAEEVKAARELFDRLTKKGKYSAFYVKGRDGEQGRRMDEFDADAEKIILVPQIAGG